MRLVIWLLLIFMAAVVAAVTLGRNDGVVAIVWQGWRVDLSLNLFLVGLIATCVVLVLAMQALDSMLSLPRRAREWRGLRRDRSAQSALREALAEHFAGRYRRAQKAAQRSAAILDETPELDGDGHGRMLAHLLTAASAHKLQGKTERDAHLKQIEALHASGADRGATAAFEGAKLLSVEWALDDRDAATALQRLEALPPGTARRTQALRLKLQAQRLERRSLEALQTARLLAKHQAFAPHAARGLIRSLAGQAIDDARDGDQLRAVWQKLDANERRDAFIVARAARAMAATEDGGAEARAWLTPLWDRLAELPADERAAVALALAQSTGGVESTWLARVEEAARRHPQDAAVAAAAGAVFSARQLWGKARTALEQAARDPRLDEAARRDAWRRLVSMARAQDDDAAARRYEALALGPTTGHAKGA